MLMEAEGMRMDSHRIMLRLSEVVCHSLVAFPTCYEVLKVYSMCQIYGGGAAFQDDLPVPQLMMNWRQTEGIQSSCSTGSAVTTISTIFARDTLAEGCQQCVVNLRNKMMVQLTYR